MKKLAKMISEDFKVGLGLAAIAALPFVGVFFQNALNVKGREEIYSGDAEYVVKYDKRDNGVVLVKVDDMVGFDFKLVDHNYNGKADFAQNFGEIPRTPTLEEQKLFSDLTSHFYQKHPKDDLIYFETGGIPFL